jgi:D-alanyl-lipoteichoic acid acyltransferase DltB (MBOAT superfamily)
MGIGKLMGMELLKNFDRPFISKNITEFWRRWHISLSTWFNDYVFTPFYTKFRNWGNMAMYTGIMLTFFLSGLWHGNNWNYIFFGVLHGGAIVLETASKKRRKKISKKMPAWLYNNLSMGLTFLFVILTWVFFRSSNLTQGFKYFGELFAPSITEVPGKLAYIPFIVVMVVWEYIQRNKKNALDMPKIPVLLRWAIYLVLSFFIMYYFGNEQAFYYFQF